MRLGFVVSLSGRSSVRQLLCGTVIFGIALFVGGRQLSAVSADSSFPNGGEYRVDNLATTVTTVSAASFESVPVAPTSIVSAFGASLANQTLTASDTDPVAAGIQLPTTLGGSTVEVNGRLAELLFVSPGQINYIIPSATETGTASLVVRSGDGTSSSGTVDISAVAAALFAANASGTGPAAALLLRVKTDGSQSYEPVAEYNSQAGRFLTKPINLGPVGERVFLILFLSGLRGATDTNGDGNLNETVRIIVEGTELTPLYAGRQGAYVGLDQINVEIPRDLIGKGVVSFSVTAPNAVSSNLVDIEISGLAGSASVSSPVVSGFGGSNALAGQDLLINGSGFSSIIEQNLVRIAGLDAEIMTASTTQLRVKVPYGVTSGTVLVRTLQGETQSSTVLPIRTSISGVVEDTLRQPITGMTVRLSDGSITATTNLEGAFVLPDVPAGIQVIEVDGANYGVTPPYPKVTLKVSAQSNRDNQFTRAISIQQATGTVGTITTTGTLAGAGDGDTTFLENGTDQSGVTIRTGDFSLEVPAVVRATFPDGSTQGSVYLTPLENGRTHVNLPLGYYSSSIVQLTPFNIKIDPGAKLVFPNTEGLPPGFKATLFRYNPDVGQFVAESNPAIVSADGKVIQTEPNAIKLTSFYFVAAQLKTTTLTGRVFENDGTTPVNRANVKFRGQEALTDGTGSYILRSAPISKGENVGVDVSFIRPDGRVDRIVSERAAVIEGGTTKIPSVRMPPRNANRPPVIQSAPTIDVTEGRVYSHPLVVNDPDLNDTLTVRVEGPSFVKLITQNGQSARPYILQISPGYADAGLYRLLITAIDSQNATSTLTIQLNIVNANRVPVALDIQVAGVEDESTQITLDGHDEDVGDTLTYEIVNSPQNGKLSGSGKVRTYTPDANFNGEDRFTYRVNDGTVSSRAANVLIQVRPVNDPPTLSLPGDQSTSYGKQLVLQINAADVDQGQSLVIAPQGQLPAGASLKQTGQSAQFTWTPTSSQIGTTVISIVVTDNGNPPASASGSFKIVVTRQ